MSTDSIYRDLVLDAMHDGGGTRDAITGKPYLRHTGYAVGIDGITVKVDSDSADKVREWLSASHAPYVGVWLSNGMLYFDSVVIIDDKATALKFARNCQQQAIYSFEEGKDIYLD